MATLKYKFGHLYHVNRCDLEGAEKGKNINMVILKRVIVAAIIMLFD